MALLAAGQSTTPKLDCPQQVVLKVMDTLPEEKTYKIQLSGHDWDTQKSPF